MGDDKDIGSNEDNKKEKTNIRSAKDATLRDAMIGVATDCDNVLMFLQSVAFKAPQILAATISPQAESCATN